MQITITYAREPGEERSGPITVGWLREPEKGGVLYDPPERVVFRPPNRSHAKSAARCPAVINLESRYFMVKCPFDLEIGFARGKEGRAVLVDRSGAAGPVRSAKLGEALTMVGESEWRYPDRPTLQLKLPYIFVADEPVFVTQLDAFSHYRRRPLPGTILGGRFPIHIWPRPLMWAFEWPELMRYIEHISGAVNYVNQTFSLFRAAEAARPTRLLVPRTKT
jgi:hypothetical protein